MSSQGFDKNSGPGTGTRKQQIPFGYAHPSGSPSSWFNGSSQKFEDYQSLAGPPSIPFRNPGNVFTGKSQAQDLKRTRSPPLLSSDKELQDSRTAVGRHSVPQRTKSPPRIYQKNQSGQDFGPSSETKRPSVSPPRISTQPNSHTDPRNHVWLAPSANLHNTQAPTTNSTEMPVLKRSRVPFPTSTDLGFQGNNNYVQDDTERELQAKAKRLARFRDELSQPESSDPGSRNQKAQQLDQSGVDKRKFISEASDTTGRLRNSNLSSDVEDQDSSTVIIGYCPDMCPEQERAERERKGDLDQYERLDGDRNQTTESLAVKKYTRTAEREAALIRPMEILQKTMDYLLNLLDQPYDDKFLGLYNFLWDRMRAVRMDLRMQHIFNLGAITMLEQMIRLHIIAMHELCQYTKGEGFSEGFDAHLNIEQMNKTSVELFQLYDDHRKKGTEVPTEREFRGYYALLKLDKHPGYKVEPAELSLDLAKMTPGIRQAAQVLFARNVARACRTGNFIVFFRLVRKASYLQACLMHAHFGKLRTQALASLHSGLQNNQGIPVTQVAKWLGMEEENMEDLLEYHGFSIKEFEEPYMVKEQPFLNGDSEYPLKCSKLVHMKKSTTVFEDVLSSSLMEPLPSKLARKGFQVDTPSIQEAPPVLSKETQTSTKAIDSDMADYEPVSSAKVDTQGQPNRWILDHPHMEVSSPSPHDIFKTNTFFGSPKVITTSAEKKPSYDKRFRNSLEKHVQSNVYTTPPQVTPTMSVVETLPDLRMASSVGASTLHSIPVEESEPEEPADMIREVTSEVDTTSVDQEVAEAKLRLILRLWRRRALAKKDLRYKKQVAATAALSSLSLGPPMRHYKEHLRVPNLFNIDLAMCERYEKQEQLWSTLNVSEVVAAKLRERNPFPRCICWKLLLCSSETETGSKVSHHLDPGPWVRSKLMPAKISGKDGLIAAFPGLSIWKKQEFGKWYFSVVKDVQFDDTSLDETVMGASGVLFIVSERISWEAQKVRFLKLVSSIPFGSCLPLLVLSGSHESLTIVENLGLNEVDKSRITRFSVVSFFNDEHLRKGLEWLASESPVQPTVHPVTTRELVLTHLRSSSHVLTELDASRTTPEHCISATNKALDDSINEIRYAVKANHSSWPCPEISLLNELEPEPLSSLPPIGWSYSTRIEPLIQTLTNSKLPTIPNPISWCSNSNKGCKTRIDVENRRLQLEHFLVSYLTPLMGLPLARKETSILIQKHVGLELHGSGYYLIPKWVMIFRRVFNWNLMSLSNGPFTTAYILDGGASVGSESVVDESYNLTSPCLDEMVQVCCAESESEPDYETAPNDSAPVEVGSYEARVETALNDSVQEDMKESKENEKSLSRLLEQCNIVQNLIDKKLSAYF